MSAASEADEATLHEVVRAILRAEGFGLFADEGWAKQLAHHREMVALYGDVYLRGRSLMTDAFRHAGIALAASNGPSPEVAELRAEVERLTECLTAAQADAARMRETGWAYLNALDGYGLLRGEWGPGRAREPVIAARDALIKARAAFGAALNPQEPT